MPIEISGTTVIDDSRNIVNVNNFGNSDTVYTGNGANLSDIEFGARNFVASGTIPNGSPVVINTDGTVGAVTQTILSTPTVGDPIEFESADIREPAVVYDSTNQKVVIFYADYGNSNQGTAIVGTVSGTDIIFGAPVIFETGDTAYISAVYDSTNSKIVIAYRDSTNSNRGTSRVGTVSGTSISFGAHVIFETNSVNETTLAYDSTNEKVFLACRTSVGGSQARSFIGTVSGTSISFGSYVLFNANPCMYMKSTFDSTNSKIILAYSDLGDSYNSYAVVGTVSGTSISYGTPVEFETGTTANKYYSLAYDTSSEKVVLSYKDRANSDAGTIKIGTVSGTDISFGSAVVTDTTYTAFVTYDPDSNRTVLTFENKASLGTVSGTSISVGSSTTWDSGVLMSQQWAAYDSSNKKVIVAYRDANNSGYGSAVVLKNLETNLTTENYVGLAAESISDTATGKIIIAGGINESQSGLTTARKYYVQDDGTLDTDPGIPSVEAGVSISATQINVGA